jgi:diacylglycerol kinase (ATP)
MRLDTLSSRALVPTRRGDLPANEVAFVLFGVDSTIKNNIMEKNFNKPVNRLKGFTYAFRGLSYVFIHEPNARIHMGILVLVIIMGVLLHIETFEWIMVAICSGMVITTEVVNTSIEKLVDMVSPDINEKAGIVKDIAAGAVLFTAMISVITGFLIFIPPILQLF